MVLTLTGMSVFYADTSWAPVVMRWLGGPKTAAVIHRTFAVVFLSVFVVQLIHLAAHLLQIRGKFIAPASPPFWLEATPPKVTSWPRLEVNRHDIQLRV